MTEVRIEGTTAPEFAPVRALFERNMRNLTERNTQLCIYHAGECVVDLWATAHGDADFDGDSLVNIFSSGKSFEAIALASLLDRTDLDYRAPIARYWPEFAVNGKADISVADLMRHEAGLAAFDTSLPMEDLHTQGIQDNRVGAIIAAQAPRFRRSSRREYHALTRGWIVNEVFRRLDPQGRTIGQYLRQELNPALGVRVLVGLEQDELAERSAVLPVSMGVVMREGLKPSRHRRMEHSLVGLARRLAPLAANFGDRSARGQPAPIAGFKRITDFNDPRIAMGETSSANTHSNARSLARTAAAMAAGGALGNQRLLNEAACESLHGNVINANTGFAHTHFTQGGVARFGHVPPRATLLDQGLNIGREGFFGWMGLGGSLFQWHPQKQLGVGYVPTSLNVFDLVNERGKAYQAQALRCIA